MSAIGSQIGQFIERKRAEGLVRTSEARFRQLADAMPQIVWAARPDGFIDYYNERWYEFTGFARGAETNGEHSWVPILHPDDAQRCKDTYYNCIASGTVSRFSTVSKIVKRVVTAGFSAGPIRCGTSMGEFPVGSVPVQI